MTQIETWQVGRGFLKHSGDLGNHLLRLDERRRVLCG
jgi:hypothetical protein